MTTIGLPKGLFYFEHNILWVQFFKNLGCNVITSQDTNKQILDYGVKCCSNETCLPVKVFHGHVYCLKNTVDYVFIPRYTSLDKKQYTCSKFCGLPDMALLNLKRQVKVLEVRLHVDMFPSETFDSLLEISHVLNLKYEIVVEAFRSAGVFFEEYIRNWQKSNRYVKSTSNSKPALSVLGHPYMIYDSYLSMDLIDKLSRRNFNIYTPKYIDYETKKKHAYPFQGKVFWDVGFELLRSAFTFAEDSNIKGIIYLTPFACGIDAFILEFIERRINSKYDIPLLKLTIDEHTGEAGFDTRLDVFLDMVG